MSSKINLLICLFFILHLWAAANVTAQKIGIYEIKKGDFSVKVTNYGARVISVLLPDKHGNIGDIVLGYDTIQEYMNDTNAFGAIVGRVANRISGARFTLYGTHYKLIANDGNNTLHGGPKGFDHIVWKVSKYTKGGANPRITLTYHSPDGEQGFPGDLLVSVTYALKDRYKLIVTMKAKALNKATPVNLAQHTYWNLGGHNSGHVLSNEIQIFASHITPLDEHFIPTGQIVPVKNTPYDFLKPREVGSQFNKLQNGYNINYRLESTKKMKPVAIVHDKKSGRAMNLQATAPGVQFYTSNSLVKKGKGGYVYQPYSALCLETQGFPDAVNHPNFPSTIVTPNKSYFHEMLFTFSVKKY
ncbi:galactose mutarotase isoform X3 [Capsicum annuum]|uniref:galactose mutarotase isoform X3 n=1 Tax=Capsicum annuum TaxID=4072 RepID=UPI001FB0A164|nr:galactose mutarotase isoform X3 [Capsicum annuum]